MAAHLSKALMFDYECIKRDCVCATAGQFGTI